MVETPHVFFVPCNVVTRYVAHLFCFAFFFLFAFFFNFPALQNREEELLERGRWRKKQPKISRERTVLLLCVVEVQLMTDSSE
jgi:hypothetical protein